MSIGLLEAPPDEGGDSRRAEVEIRRLADAARLAGTVAVEDLTPLSDDTIEAFMTTEQLRIQPTAAIPVTASQEVRGAKSLPVPESGYRFGHQVRVGQAQRLGRLGLTSRTEAMLWGRRR
jgi:hypothetical protein